MVSQNTRRSAPAPTRISAAADDLSKRTEQQAASLEETAAALDQITATVRKTSEGATHARSLVGKAKTDAEHSGQVVLQAVDAMSGIEKSSNQISQIIGVIDEIAFQTNLLALNAASEAARAGDAGRGFAVVASEVRALAQQFRRRRQGDQDVDLDLERPGRAGRRPRRRDRQGPGAHLRPDQRDQRHRERHRRLRPGTGHRARSGQYRRQPDGPGDPAERRHGRGEHRGQPFPVAGDRENSPN